MTASSEIDQYLSEDVQECDSLSYWQVNASRYPNLSTLARKHLAAPATSAPVESLFSVAGKIFRPERCLLADKTFESLMFIRCNSNVF